MFVKPANMGSSVGVIEGARPSRSCATPSSTRSTYDEWVVVEEAIAGREIEVAVLGNIIRRRRVPGEIVPGEEFYDYEDKYVDDGAQLLVPAPLSRRAMAEVRALAIARVPCCGARASRGWTSSRGGRPRVPVQRGQHDARLHADLDVPEAVAATGVTYPELIDRLVELALERHARRRRNTKH